MSKKIDYTRYRKVKYKKNKKYRKYNTKHYKWILNDKNIIIPCNQHRTERNRLPENRTYFIKSQILFRILYSVLTTKQEHQQEYNNSKSIENRRQIRPINNSESVKLIKAPQKEKRQHSNKNYKTRTTRPTKNLIEKLFKNFKRKNNKQDIEKNHILKTSLDTNYTKNSEIYYQLIEKLPSKDNSYLCSTTNINNSDNGKRRIFNRISLSHTLFNHSLITGEEENSSRRLIDSEELKPVSTSSSINKMEAFTATKTSKKLNYNSSNFRLNFLNLFSFLNIVLCLLVLSCTNSNFYVYSKLPNSKKSFMPTFLRDSKKADESPIFDTSKLKSLEISNCNCSPSLQYCLQLSPKNLIFVVDAALGIETRRKVQRFLINTSHCFFNYGNFSRSYTNSIYKNRNTRISNHFTFILYDSVDAAIKAYIQPKSLQELTKKISSINLSKVKTTANTRKFRTSNLLIALNNILNRNLLQRNAYKTKVVIFANRIISNMPAVIPKINTIKRLAEVFVFGLGASNQRQLVSLVTLPLRSHLFYLSKSSVQLLHYSNSLAETVCNRDTRSMSAKKSPKHTILTENLKSGRTWISFNLDTLNMDDDQKINLNYNIDWYPKHGFLGEQNNKFFNITGLSPGKVYLISVRPIINKQILRESESMITFNTIPMPVREGSIKLLPHGKGLDKKLLITWINPRNIDGTPTDSKVKVFVKENNRTNPNIRTIKSQVGSAEVVLDKYGCEYEVFIQSWILKNSPAISRPLVLKKSLPPLPPLRVNFTGSYLDFDPHIRTRFEKFHVQLFTPFGYYTRNYKNPTGMIPGSSLLPQHSPLNPDNHFHKELDLAGTYKPDRYYLKIMTESNGLVSNPVMRSFNYLSRNPGFNRMLLSLSNNTVCYFNLRVMRVGNCLTGTEAARIESFYLNEITGDLEQIFIDGRRTFKGVFDIFVNGNPVVKNVQMPFSMHYDSLGNNIYWSDNNGINVVHNTKNPITNQFVISQHSRIIRSSSVDSSTTWFTIDTVRRKLYYVSSDLDKSNNKKFFINQSDMDGSDSKVFHEFNLVNSTCLGLAVNITDGAVFWLQKDGVQTTIKTQNVRTKRILSIWSHPKDLFFIQIIGTKIAVYSTKDGSLYISGNRFEPKTISQIAISRLDIAWLSSFDFKAHNNLMASRLPLMAKNPCINQEATCNGICIPLGLNTRHTCISVCNIWETHCRTNNHGYGYKCIQKNLVCDGVKDCPLGDDEENCPTEEELKLIKQNSEPATLKFDELCDGWIDFRNGADEANCEYTKNRELPEITAEDTLKKTAVPPKFEENICTFDRNDTICNLKQSKLDDFDWRLNQGNTPTPLTGPSNITVSNFIIQNNINNVQAVATPKSVNGHVTKVPIATRQYPLYMYLESTGKKPGQFADLILHNLIQGPYCLLMGAMLYGTDLGSLNVILVEYGFSEGAPKYERLMLQLTQNTGQTWNFYKIDAKCESRLGCDLVIRGIIGNGPRSDIAVQSLQVSQTICHKHLDCQFDNDYESSCHSLGMSNNWKKTYSLSNISSLRPVRKVTQMSNGRSSAQEAPAEWIFYDFILGNACTLCPNGVKMLRRTLSKMKLYVGIIICSPEEEYQLWLGDTKEGIFYPIAVEQPSEIPCELMMDAVTPEDNKQATNPRLNNLFRQDKIRNHFNMVNFMDRVELKSCAANFVYNRISEGLYSLKTPQFYGGYAQPFNIAVKQSCGMGFDMLKAFDLPRLHHIAFDSKNLLPEDELQPLSVTIKRPLDYSDDIKESWCFLFRYYNKNSKITVSLEKDIMWEATDSTTTTMWNLQQFDIPVPITSYKIFIQPGVSEQNYGNAYIGIDDIQVLPYPCNTATLVCKFTARQVLNTCLWNFHRADVILKVTETPTSLPEIVNDWARQPRNAITSVETIRSPELQILRPLYSYMCFEMVYQVIAKNPEKPFTLKLMRNKMTSSQTLFEQTLEQPQNRQPSPWLKLKYELSALELTLDKFILTLSGLETIAIASISTTIGRCSDDNVVNPNISDNTKQQTKVVDADASGFENNLCSDKASFECKTTKKCIPYYQLCDSKNDCGDWSDEIGCLSGCGNESDENLTSTNKTVGIFPTGRQARCLWRYNVTSEIEDELINGVENLTDEGLEPKEEKELEKTPTSKKGDDPVGIILNIDWNKNKKNLTSDVNDAEKFQTTINSFFKDKKYIKLSAFEACYLDIFQDYERDAEGEDKTILTRVRFKEDKFTRKYFIENSRASILLASFYEKIQSVESNVYLLKAVSENLEVTYKAGKKSECDLVCADGKCVKDNFKCDGIPGCDDESDETDCFRLEPKNFTISPTRPPLSRKVLMHYCWKRKAFIPVCENESKDKTQDIADKACYHMGYWKASSYSTVELDKAADQKGTFSMFPTNGTALHQSVDQCKRLISMICEPFPCGTQLNSQDDGYSSEYMQPTMRIVGGQKAKPNQWPWAISLHHNNKHNCGGTMVSDRHIVSAAHCFDFNDPIDHVVRIGTIRTIEAGAIERKVKRGIIHEKYNPTINIPDYDIAIVFLTEAVPISKSFVPICLPKYNIPHKPGDVCYVAGWGKQNDQFGSFPEQLYDVSTPILPNKKCLQGEYSKPEYHRQGVPITDRQLCAGILWGGGFGFCHGDSGGGLYCQDRERQLTENSWVLHGIVSWSVGCASVDRPDVYTRTRKFIDFIEDKTQVTYNKNPGSDGKTRQQEFGLRKAPLNMTCGGNITEFSPHNNIITNPNWPDKFPENVECAWNIIAPKGHTISINFLFFNLLSDRLVTKLTITESDKDYNRSVKRGVYSGTQVPKKFFSEKEIVTIRFVTKGPAIWKATNGFMLEYFFEDVTEKTITSLFKKESKVNCNFNYTQRNDMVEFSMEPNYILPCNLKIIPENFKHGNETIILKFFAVELGSFYEYLSVKTKTETIEIEGHNVINKKKNITSHDSVDLIFDSQLGFESTAYFRFSYSTVMRKPDMAETTKVIINQVAVDNQQTTAVFEQLITETSCKDTISNSTGQVTVVNSPNHPYTYPRLSSCYWRLENKNKDQLIELTFKIFQVEFSSKCQYDGLKVITRKDLMDIENDPDKSYNKNDPSSWSGVITFCGKTVPPTVITEGPIAYLGFYSDEFQGYEGFKIYARAIDRVQNEIAAGDLGERKELFKCDFEDGLCGMRQIPATQSKYRWLKNHDYTTSQATGPPYDKSMSGHYLYTEATEVKPGVQAKIFTPIFPVESVDDSKQNPKFCLSFYFDMFGESMGTLKVYLHTEETASQQGILLWSRSGEQRTQTDLPWSEQAKIEFIPSSSFFVEFQGIRGVEYKSDMAIDEILLVQGKCTKCSSVEGMSQCGNKRNECYPEELRCDGYKDCVDGEDELNCPKNATVITIDDETEEKNICFGMKSDEDLCNGKLDCLGGYDEINCVENNQKDKCGVVRNNYDLRTFKHTPLNITDWPNLATISVNDQFVCLGALVHVDQYNAWFITSTTCTAEFYQHPDHMLDKIFPYGEEACSGIDTEENISVKKQAAHARKLLTTVSAETSKNVFTSLAEVIQHKSSLVSILKFDIVYAELAGFYDQIIEKVEESILEHNTETSKIDTIDELTTQAPQVLMTDFTKNVEAKIDEIYDDDIEDIGDIGDIEYEIPEVKPEDIGTPACLDKNKVFQLSKFLKSETTFQDCVMLHVADNNFLHTSSKDIPENYTLSNYDFFITPVPIWNRFDEIRQAGVSAKDVVWTGYKSKSFSPPDGSLIYCKGLIDQSTRGWLLSGIVFKTKTENYDNLEFSREHKKPDKYGKIKYDTLTRERAFQNNPYLEYQYLEHSLGTTPVYWVSSLAPWIQRGACPGQFSCNDGTCINEEYLCDTVQHCPDGEDETADQCYKDHQCDNVNFWNNHGGETKINLHLENLQDEKVTKCYWVLHPPRIKNEKGETQATHDYGFAVWEMFSFYAPGYELAISFYNQRGEQGWLTYRNGIDVHVSNYRNRNLAVRIVKIPKFNELEESNSKHNNSISQTSKSTNYHDTHNLHQNVGNHIHLSAKLYWSRQLSCKNIGGYLCKNNVRCISKQLLCNGVIDCGPEGDDEINCQVECGKNLFKPAFLNTGGILRHIPALNKLKPKDKIEMKNEIDAENDYMKYELSNQCSFIIHAPENYIVEMNIFKGFETVSLTNFDCSHITVEQKEAPTDNNMIVRSGGRNLKVTIDTKETFQANYKFTRQLENLHHHLVHNP